MGIQTIEFKVREAGNENAWEDIQITTTIALLEDTPRRLRMATDEMIKQLKNQYNVREIRWNYQNSLQGHYVR